MVTRDGFLLGGKVHYRQPATGFRSGIEPVLLAASIPAAAGERVLEAGTGAGAALLCLRKRVPGITGTGIEIDESMAALAEENLSANGFEGIGILAANIETTPLDGGFHHVLANPPYHPADGTESPLLARERSKRGSEPLIRSWVAAMARALRRRGSLTLIVPAWLVPASLSAMTEADCGGTILFPLWPKAERSAKLVLLRGIKETRSPLRVSPGLVLHQADGAFTDAAHEVLTGGAALPLGR